jgi:hypothetical protein
MEINGAPKCVEISVIFGNGRKSYSGRYGTESFYFMADESLASFYSELGAKFASLP